MAGLQAKEWYAVCKSKYDIQIARSIFTITTLFYNHKAIERKWVFKLKKILTGLLKDTRLDGLQKGINRYKAVTIKKLTHLLYAVIYQEFYLPSQLN